MDVFEAVRTLLAVRSYQDKAVPEEAIRQILEAGRLSASASNKQPWHFIVVENRETLAQLGALSRSGPYIAQAPLAIAVVIENTALAISDGSRAIQSMVLTAWEQGIGSNWVGFKGMNEVKSLLGIPEELEILGILPFGYPTEDIGQGKKKRKPLNEIAHRERFGQPLE